jgi:hypothetical protein
MEWKFNFTKMDYKNYTLTDPVVCFEGCNSQKKHLNSENTDLTQQTFVLDPKVIQWQSHSINIQ